MIFRLGRCLFDSEKGPGLYFILPCIDNIVKIDLRTIVSDLKTQEILTKDFVSITVNAVVYYRIFSAILAVNSNCNAQHATHLLSATTLRSIIGAKTLQQILQERVSIAEYAKVKIH